MSQRRVSPADAKKLLTFEEKLVDCSGCEVKRRYYRGLMYLNGSGGLCGTARSIYIVKKAEVPLSQILRERRFKQRLAPHVSRGTIPRSTCGIDEQLRKE